LEIERGTARTEKRVVDSDVVLYNLEHRFPVVFYKPVADLERPTPKRGTALMGRQDLRGASLWMATKPATCEPSTSMTERHSPSPDLDGPALAG
jgi:hypothetical protein